MGVSSRVRFVVISVVEPKNKRATLKERFAAVLQVKIEMTVSVQGYVKVGGLEHGVITRPLARTESGEENLSSGSRSFLNRRRIRRIGIGWGGWIYR
jgi:hypothetical protein|tara:strand:- start:1903 stop:2193 length:291 start_codon:yes stop_codon:yes gene_type:complete